MSDDPVNEAERITRAAFTVQQAFLDFREVTWHIFLTDVIAEGKAIILTKDSSKKGRRNGWFAHFPHHLVRDSVVKSAILTTMSCHELGHMKNLIEQVFKGIDVLIEEVRVRLQIRPMPRTMLVAENGDIDYNDHDFWTMRVTSRTTGKQWALDVCGPQYDMQVPCFEWEFLCKHYSQDILVVKPFGTLAEYTTKQIEIGGLIGLELEIGAQAMQAFHKVVDAGMQKKGLTWSAIFGREREDYMRHRAKIIKVGKKAMEGYVAGEHWTKKRLKAERYEKRHEHELDFERARLREMLR